MLMVHHPLEGEREAAIKCLDLPAMMRCTAPSRCSSSIRGRLATAPVAGLHDNALAFWPIYPRFLRDLFTRAFTEGLRDPQHGRVRESEWRAAMVRLRDAIVYCAGCQAENFYDAGALRGAGGRPGACWACGEASSCRPASASVARSSCSTTTRCCFRITSKTAGCTTSPARRRR